jgi:hypothetical protein
MPFGEAATLICQQSTYFWRSRQSISLAAGIVSTIDPRLLDPTCMPNTFIQTTVDSTFDRHASVAL